MTNFSERLTPEIKITPAVIPDGYHLRELDRDEYSKYFSEWAPKVFDSNQPVLHPKRSPDKEVRRNELKKKFYESTWSIRLGIFAGCEIAGFTFTQQESADVVHMHISAILPLHRRKGLYSALLQETLVRSANEGFEIVTSNHNPANAPVIIAKMKAGFVISGYQVMDIVGPLVQLSRYLEPGRHSAMTFRLGYGFADESILNALRSPDKRSKKIY